MVGEWEKEKEEERRRKKKREGEWKRVGGFPEIDEIGLLLQIGLLRFSFPPFPISDENKAKLTMQMTSATHTKRAAKRATLLLIVSLALSFFVVVVVVIDNAIPSPTRNSALPPIAWE